MNSRKPLTLTTANTSAEIPCKSYHNNNLQVQQEEQNNHTSDNSQKQQYQPHQPDRKLTYLSNNHQNYGAPRQRDSNESASIEDGYWQVQTRQQNTNRFNLSRRNTESVKEDTTLAEEEEDENEFTDLNSTQRLRSGFFRAIKRQYNAECRYDAEQSIIATSPIQSCSSARNETGLEDNSSKQPSAVPMKFPIQNDQRNINEESLSFISMKRSARRKLNQLRKCDPSQVDIQTGLQWIRLELNEMREQDKSIFLQLAKVYSNLKDLKSELNHKNNDEDFEYSCEDFYQLPSWWSSHGKIDEFRTMDHVQASPASIFSSPALTKTATNFSASDGAQFVRALSVQNHRRRRGRSPLPVPLPSAPLVFNF